MKPITFIIALSLGISSLAQAQSGNKRTRISYLFSLMKQDSLVLKQMDASVAASRNMSNSVLNETHVKLDSSMLKKRDEFMQKVMSKSKENALKLINEDMVEIYDQYFTNEDIEAFCLFYESPAGKKMARILPTINKDIMTRSVTKYQPEVMKLVREFMDESKKAFDEKYK